MCRHPAEAIDRKKPPKIYCSDVPASVRTERSWLGGSVARTRKPAFGPHHFLKRAVSAKMGADHPKGKVIYSQGNSSNSLFFIRKGTVKLAVVSKQGKDRNSRRGRLPRGKLRGGPALAQGDGHRPHTVFIAAHGKNESPAAPSQEPSALGWLRLLSDPMQHQNRGGLGSSALRLR